MATVEAAPPAKQAFKFPRVYPGCEIVISRKPNMVGAIRGNVLEAGMSSVSAVCIMETGIKIFFSCWHKDDPRLTEKWEAFLADDDHGIFDLSEKEKESRMLVERVVSMEAREAEIVKSFDDLKKSLAQTDKQLASLLSKSRKSDD